MCPGPQLRLFQLFTPLLALYLLLVVCLIIVVNLVFIYFYSRHAILNKMLIIGTLLFAGSYWLPVDLWYPWVQYLI